MATRRKTIAIILAIGICLVSSITIYIVLRGRNGQFTVDPPVYSYLGPVSDDCPTIVIETYVWDRLIFAQMDADGDDLLDLFISFSDHGSDIECLIPLEGGGDQAIRANAHRAKPAGFKPCPILEKVAHAATRPEDFSASPEVLCADDLSQNDRWLVALALQQTTLSPETLQLLYEELMKGKYSRQLAFILSGRGEEGVRLIGKALKNAEDPKTARDCAIYLSQIEDKATPALADLVSSLDRDWRNTRDCVLLAILNIANESPGPVRPYRKIIDKYKDSEDESISYKAYLIVNAL